MRLKVSANNYEQGVKCDGVAFTTLFTKLVGLIGRSLFFFLRVCLFVTLINDVGFHLFILSQKKLLEEENEFLTNDRRRKTTRRRPTMTTTRMEKRRKNKKKKSVSCKL